MEETMSMGQEDQQSPPHRRIKPPEAAQPPPPQKCPRCDSSNTKFCYYNNYSVSQPRYFCKACRRYWTQGGTLRNVPIGGGCRKNKRSKTSASGSSSSGEMVRVTQPLPGPTRPLNYPGMDPGQGPRPGYYAGGTLLSSFGGMQTLSAGLNPLPQANLNAGGRFGGLVPFQGNGYFPSHQNQGLAPVSNWAQSFVNRGNGGGTSFNANQWSSDGSSSSQQQGYNPPH